MKPFFTYSGGKHRLAGKYPSPKHDLIIEPFAGSAGYATRHYERDVLLIDLDPRVATLWEYLIAASPSDILSLPLYDGTWETVDDLDLTDGERMVIRGWLNKGTFGKRPSAWMRSGKYPSQFWGKEIRQRIADQVPKIKHWKIQNASYTAAPDLPATWFVDPPYQRKGGMYVGHTDLNFVDLGEWCRARTGQTIVCENLGAKWLPFRAFAVMHAMQGTRRSGRSLEAIWTQETA